MRTDGGTEYGSNELESWLRKNGIRHETTVFHTPQQNRLAELINHTLFEGDSTLFTSNKYSSNPMTVQINVEIFPQIGACTPDLAYPRFGAPRNQIIYSFTEK
jgi:transposase InsO family protein